MSSVPLPVRLGWYAWRFAATTAEIQMRMTHAMFVTLRQARPLAPADWREVSKFKATAPMEPDAAAPMTMPAKPKTAAKAKAVTMDKAVPQKPHKVAAPVRGPIQTKAKSKAATPRRSRRIPSAPPPMPNGRLEG